MLNEVGGVNNIEALGLESSLLKSTGKYLYFPFFPTILSRFPAQVHSLDLPSPAAHIFQQLPCSTADIKETPTAIFRFKPIHSNIFKAQLHKPEKILFIIKLIFKVIRSVTFFEIGKKGLRILVNQTTGAAPYKKKISAFKYGFVMS